MGERVGGIYTMLGLGRVEVMELCLCVGMWAREW